MSFPTPEPTVLQRMAGKPRRRRWLTVGLPLLGVLLVAGGGFAGWQLTHRTDPQVAACHTAVSAQLKAPATAKWPGETRTVDHDANGTAYTVLSGAVDAENGLGSLVRTRFECVFNPDGTLRRADLSG